VSALPFKADSQPLSRHVRFGPEGDIGPSAISLEAWRCSFCGGLSTWHLLIFTPIFLSILKCGAGGAVLFQFTAFVIRMFVVGLMLSLLARAPAIAASILICKTEHNKDSFPNGTLPDEGPIDCSQATIDSYGCHEWDLPLSDLTQSDLFYSTESQYKQDSLTLIHFSLSISRTDGRFVARRTVSNPAHPERPYSMVSEWTGSCELRNVSTKF
jgi:hypothetical protein